MLHVIDWREVIAVTLVCVCMVAAFIATVFRDG